jgi:hypothetical protein
MAGFADASKVDVEKFDSGLPRGTMYHIAVMAWFRAGGEPLPMSFKFEDDNGMVQTVRDITLLSVEDKNYSGIPSKEFNCEAVVGGLIRQFQLIFYLEACKWVMMI